MLKKSAEQMVFFFVKKGVIDEEVKDVYIYGSELLISEMICTLLVMGIGLYAGKFIETLLYLASYIPIRIYAGGYHATSHRNCTVIFNLCYIVIFFVVDKMLSLKLDHILYILSIGSGLIVIILAPIEDLRKPLDEREKYIYGEKAKKRVLLLLLFAIIIAWLIPQWKEKICYGISAVCEIAVLLLVGYTKNKILLNCKRYYVTLKE